MLAAIVVGGLILAGGGYAGARLTILKDTPAGSVSAESAAAGAGARTGDAPAASAKASPAIVPTAVAVPVPATPTLAVATPTPTPTGATETPDVSSAVVARAQLEALVAHDAAGPMVRGQWVAQLSSKSEGTLDKTLQAGPFTVPDILAEHLRLRKDPSIGSLVRVVHLGDWGAIVAPASPMWITVADINAGSTMKVTAWCEAHFSQRGTKLNNVCMARQLTLRSG